MTVKHLLIAFIGLSLLTSFSLVDSNIHYITLIGLNTDNYKEIKAASKIRDDIGIESVCVPAEIIKMKYTGDSSSAISELRDFFNSNAEFESIEFLENYTEENYFEKCSDARVGR